MRDTGSFDEFYRATAARAVRFGYAVTGDQGEAQDLVQEAYTRAWRHWSTVSVHPDPESWVRLVVSRLAKDRWRRMTKLRAILNRGGGPPDVPAPSDNTVLLTRALRQLPQSQRQALALHYLYDMPVDDIAVECRVPAGTVKSWLSRGRARLAALLADETTDRKPEATDVR